MRLTSSALRTSVASSTSMRDASQRSSSVSTVGASGVSAFGEQHRNASGGELGLDERGAEGRQAGLVLNEPANRVGRISASDAELDAVADAAFRLALADPDASHRVGAARA